jgi:C-terminal processing protease CtpA/Prc
MLEGDVIARIDERAPTSLEDARRHLSGPLGDDVLVEVLREGEIHKLRVARERVRRLPHRLRFCTYLAP